MRASRTMIAGIHKASWKRPQTAKVRTSDQEGELTFRSGP